MTIQEMHDLFDILQDTYGSAYFTDTEKDLLLNRAQVALIEEYISPKKSNITPEQKSLILEDLDSIVYPLTGITSAANGNITAAQIQTVLNTASSTTEPYLIILNATFGGEMAKFVRHNDYYKFQKNTFKAASTEYPQYRIFKDGLTFSPAAASAVELTVLKRPVDMALGVQESELPDKVHNDLVAIGIEFASIATRDEALLQIKNLTK